MKKWAFLGGGVAAIVIGVLTYSIPVVPSDFVILFGVASVAQASWSGARLLDWLELKLQPIIRPAVRLWKRLPRWAQMTLAVLWMLGVACLGYLVYGRFWH